MSDQASQRLMILEDLQNKKFQLQSQSSLRNESPVRKKDDAPKDYTPAEKTRLQNDKNTALQQSNKQSDGFFITQNSLFGNLIISVIPRFNSDGTLSHGNIPKVT